MTRLPFFATITVPRGTYEIEVTVTGGIRFVRWIRVASR